MPRGHIAIPMGALAALRAIDAHVSSPGMNQADHNHGKHGSTRKGETQFRSAFRVVPCFPVVQSLLGPAAPGNPWLKRVVQMIRVQFFRRGPSNGAGRRSWTVWMIRSSVSGASREGWP